MPLPRTVRVRDQPHQVHGDRSAARPRRLEPRLRRRSRSSSRSRSPTGTARRPVAAVEVLHAPFPRDDRDQRNHRVVTILDDRRRRALPDRSAAAASRPSTDTGLRSDPGVAIAPMSAAIDSGCSRSASAHRGHHRADDDHRRQRRSGGGPDEVQVFEQAVERVIPRRLAFGVQPRQDVALDAAAILATTRHHTLAQQRADVGQAAALHEAPGTSAQVGLDAHLQVDRQFSVVIPRPADAAPDGSSTRSSRRLLQPRAQRLPRARQPGLDRPQRHTE